MKLIVSVLVCFRFERSLLHVVICKPQICYMCDSFRLYQRFQSDAVTLHLLNCRPTNNITCFLASLSGFFSSVCVRLNLGVSGDTQRRFPVAFVALNFGVFTDTLWRFKAAFEPQNPDGFSSKYHSISQPFVASNLGVFY